MPARPAMAIRWMIALVEPPSAMWVTSAFSKEARVRTSRGFRSSLIIATMRRPQARRHAAVGRVGGGDRRGAGQRQPSASASDIIVAAVPMVMQVP